MESQCECNRGTDSCDTPQYPFKDPQLVSIITPVYNAARWLPDTLASVRAQSYKHWEHILVDDGSTDNSAYIIEGACLEDRRFRLLRTARNSGPSAARNRAIQGARGRFLAFLDADDLWLPDTLDRCLEWTTTHHFDFVYHDYRHISADGTGVGLLVKAPDVLDFKTLHIRRGYGGCLAFVIDRSAIPRVRFPVKCRYLHEDLCAWLGLVQHGHVGHRVPFDLGRYRVSENSRSANKWRSASETWAIYREVSHLPLLRAVHWFLRYAWDGFWLQRKARPI
jgi:teichuronic acid biosynthesis glycosyltransferase TuaG